MKKSNLEQIRQKEIKQPAKVFKRGRIVSLCFSTRHYKESFLNLFRRRIIRKMFLFEHLEFKHFKICLTSSFIFYLHLPFQLRASGCGQSQSTHYNLATNNKLYVN